MPKNDDVFIKYHETIRQMLHQLFVYGCYDRVQGAARQGTSDRSYSTNIRRIKYFWPDDLAAERAETNKKIHRFPLPSAPAQGNILARSYAIKAFNAQDLNLYIFLLSALADQPPQTAAALVDAIKENVFTDYGGTAARPRGKKQGEPVYYPMVRDKLEAMAAAGFLEKEAAGRNARYRIADNLLARLAPEDLDRLDRAVLRCRDRMPLSALGYGVQRAIEGTIASWNGDDLPPAPPPAREGVFYQSVLDDEVVWGILAAIEHRRKITFSVDRDPGSPLRGVTPVRILRDTVYGRQYLFARTAKGRACLRRIDRIRNLSEEDATFAPEAAAAVLPLLDRIWCASLDDARSKRAPAEDVVLAFRFDGLATGTAETLKTRLQRERRQGTIEPCSEALWRYRIAVRDPVEMIPWIRTYGRCVSVEAPAALRDRMARDTAQLRASYAAGGFAEDASSAKARRKPLPPNPGAPCETPFFTEFRNAYFFAALELYDRMILGGESFPPAALAAFLSRRAFPLPSALGDRDRFARNLAAPASDIHRPALFHALDDGRLVPRYGFAPAGKEHEPADYGTPLPFLLTTLEKRWLMSLLKESAAREELGDALTEKLAKLLSCQPFPFEDAILTRGPAAPETTLPSDNTTFSIHLLLRAIHDANDIERAFLLFSTWEKEGWLDDATGRYHLVVHAYKDDTDERRVLVEKILSLGPAVLVLAPVNIKKAVLDALPL